MKKSVFDYSIEKNLPHILKEYQGDVDIKEIGFDSVVPVKWVCENGHEVIESPHIRLRRKNAFCPICGKNRKGSLAQVDPEMAKLYSKTNPISAKEIPCDSSSRVEWKCKNGHTWKRTVINQLKIRTCPICANRVPSENYSLFALHPELEKEWHKEKNVGIDAATIMPNANKKFWWKCEHNHEYECTAADRHRGKGCPYCAGKKVLEEESVYTTDTAIVEKYWDYEKNKYSPKELSRNSKRKIWIKVGEDNKLLPVSEFVKEFE